MSQTAEPEIVLDLSRLLSRALHPTPTGVDRCEMAYARGLLAEVPERLGFAAVHPVGVYGRLPREAVIRFLNATEARWTLGAQPSPRLLRSALRHLMALRPCTIPRRAGRPRLYLQASPNNLARPGLVKGILRREQARFACLLHDLIPLQYPEYARAGGATIHARRIDTIARLADGIIANSHATLAAMQPHLASHGRAPLTTVAHLGTEAHGPSASGAQAERPYFVCIGTIEPRKNHLLLLNLWRHMAERSGAAAVPRLLVIGRRGWENEQIVDMLERCPALVGCVEEVGTIADLDVRALLVGAQALLLPSFAEGYGMPVAEAIALGVPVVCSDLPALREAGGDVPHFLDPLDGPGWAAAIEDLSRPTSRLRREQTARRAGWQPSTWPQHLAKVLDLLHRMER